MNWVGRRSTPSATGACRSRTLGPYSTVLVARSARAPVAWAEAVTRAFHGSSTQARRAGKPRTALSGSSGPLSVGGVSARARASSVVASSRASLSAWQAGLDRAILEEMKRLRSLLMPLAALCLGADSLAQPASRQDATGLYRSAAKSVVVVATQTKSGLSYGSGVVIGPGRIVTNKHVVAGSNGWVAVKQGDRFWRAEVFRLGVSDLALLDVLLKVGEEFKLPPAFLRPTQTVSIGERVYAIGAPLGLEQTMSEGLISGLGAGADHGFLLQTTAAISQGSSGGGLFDSRGRLVGITIMYLDKGQQLNFALPADEVVSLTKNPPATAPTDADEDGWVELPPAVMPPPRRPLPRPLSRISCYFIGVFLDDVAQRVITKESVQIWLEGKVRKAGLQVVDSENGGECAQLAISVDSFVSDQGVVTYSGTIEVHQAVEFDQIGPRAVTTWSRGLFGFAGSNVVFSSLKTMLEKSFGEFTTARLTE